MKLLLNNLAGKSLSLEPCRVFCIGRNYTEHAKEMRAEIPDSPVIFMKPSTSLVPVNQAIIFPVHGKVLEHEAEIVILITKNGKPHTEQEALKFIGGVSLGLDLTLRDVQSELKKKQLPWEIAKAFDGSAPIGDFTEVDMQTLNDGIYFECHINESLRQAGNSKNMLFSFSRIVQEIANIWELRIGDLIYTGTPAGVGSLKKGDNIRLTSEKIGNFEWNLSGF